MSDNAYAIACRLTGAGRGRLDRGPDDGEPSLRLSLRNVDSLITAFVLPVLLMLMFVYLFGGAIHTGARYVDYVVPGVLLVCVGFGAAHDRGQRRRTTSPAGSSTASARWTSAARR